MKYRKGNFFSFKSGFTAGISVWTITGTINYRNGRLAIEEYLRSGSSKVIFINWCFQADKFVDLAVFQISLRQSFNTVIQYSQTDKNHYVANNNAIDAQILVLCDI